MKKGEPIRFALLCSLLFTFYFIILHLSLHPSTFHFLSNQFLPTDNTLRPRAVGKALDWPSVFCNCPNYGFPELSNPILHNQ